MINIKDTFKEFAQEHAVQKNAYKDFLDLARMAIDHDGGIDDFMDLMEQEDSYLMAKFGDYDEELIEEWLQMLQECYDDSEDCKMMIADDIDPDDPAFHSGKGLGIPELVHLDGVHRGGMTDRLLNSKKGLYKE